MITKAKDFSFRQLEVAVEGLLEREDHGRRFTGMLIEATLSIPDDANEEVASRLLNRAHDTCFVANSRQCDVDVDFRGSIGAASTIVQP